METLLIVGLLATLGGALPAGASISPAERCAASQLKAVGKLASASLACHATTATKQYPPNPCLTNATDAFARAWTAAEARGGCTTTDTEATVETEVGNVVDVAVAELTGTPEDALLTTAAAQACAARKLKATAKDAQGQVACDATGVEHATLISQACVDRAGSAFSKVWAAAEAQGGCATSGDEPVEDQNVYGLSAWGVTHLGPIGPLFTCGTFLTTWGSFGTGDGQFNSPVGVAVGPAGNVYVVDQGNHRIQKFDNTGTFLTTWGSKGTGDGQFEVPWAVAVDGSGNVFVTDGEESPVQRVQKFDSTGTFLTKWGSAGTGDGQFACPLGIAVGGSGNVFVTDTCNERIQEFDNTGTFLTKWGVARSGYDALGIAVGLGGNVLVDEQITVKVYTSTGTFLSSFSSGGEDQLDEIAVAGGVNIFLTDQDSSNVQLLTNTGTFLTTWGSTGSGDGQFNQPEGIAVDKNGNVFVADNGNHRIQKFACPMPPSPQVFGQPCGTCSGAVWGHQCGVSGTPLICVASQVTASVCHTDADCGSGQICQDANSLTCSPGQCGFACGF
jgi:hypothetical protein